jgi:hypothetical protein
MNALASLSWRAAVVGRWVARIAGLLMFLFVDAFVVGEGLPSLAHFSAREAAFAFGMLMLFGSPVAAWRWPRVGGAATLLGWVYLSALQGKPFVDAIFLVPAGAGLLQLLCWARLRGAPPPPFRWSRAWVAISMLLALFVALCANEMFGQPPLMTEPLEVGPALVGTWTSDVAADFTIAPDGRVTGTVANAVVLDGRIGANRSWFGQLLGWRTDYMIQGRLGRVVELPGGRAGDRFTAPVDFRGPELKGSLFLSHPGPLKPTRLALKRR